MYSGAPQNFAKWGPLSNDMEMYLCHGEIGIANC